LGSSTLKWVIRNRSPVYLLIDLIAFQLGLMAVYYLKFESGFFENPLKPQIEIRFLMSISFASFWLIIYALKGMYKNQLSTSRYEAFADVTKCAFIGLIILFILIQAIPDIQEIDKTGHIDSIKPLNASRIMLLVYVAIIIILSGGGRALFRNLIRRSFRKNIGRYKAILIGYAKRGRRLLRTLQDAPEFGYELIAIAKVDDSENTPDDIETICLKDLEEFLDTPEGREVEFVLLSLEPSNRKKLMDIIDRVSRYQLRMMIIPDFYQILVGLARSQQLYGVPLMEVFPLLLDPFSSLVKRTMDIVVSLIILTIGMPVMLLVGILVMATSKGPALYSQDRVGYRGKEFKLYKFRSMIADAEKGTGAVWATEKDPRVTPFGRFMRSTRIDELPQAWNVLKGDMSLVGPRPERRVFVNEFISKIPFYNRRHNVKPGLTGWAQIRCKYDSSIQDVREKIPYDLFYIENISISLDIKIIINTIWVMLTLKGQ